MPQIKFSHDYPKLHGQRSAVLMQVFVVSKHNLSKSFLAYDTVFVNTNTNHLEFFKLEGTKFLVLLFMGEKHIPFTTIRAAWPPSKETYYRNNIDCTFDIVIESHA